LFIRQVRNRRLHGSAAWRRLSHDALPICLVGPCGVDRPRPKASHTPTTTTSAPATPAAIFGLTRSIARFDRSMKRRMNRILRLLGRENPKPSCR